MDQDRKYLESIYKGDTQAFDKIYLAYAPRTEEFLCRMLKSREEAEDITQDIFMKIWNRREDIVKIISLRDYIFRMAKNAACDHYDRDVVRETYRLKQMKIPQVADFADKNIDTDELALLLSMAIEKMPEQRRKIFHMSRQDGKPNRQIAEELGLSIRTVENHIANAVRELKRLLTVIAFFL